MTGWTARGAACTLNSMGPAHDVFDRHARGYGDLINRATAFAGGNVEHFAQRKVDLLADLVPLDGARILDFGCGVGTMSRALARTCPSCHVTGVDPSAESIAVANTAQAEDGLPNLRYVHGAIDGLPRELGPFDLVTAACVFHHIPPARRVPWLAALRAALAPLGRLFIFEHNPLNPLTRRVVRECPLDQDAVLLSPREARALCRAAGFARADVIHYLFLPPALYRLRPLERMLRRVPLGGQFLVRAF